MTRGRALPVTAGIATAYTTSVAGWPVRRIRSHDRASPCRAVDALPPALRVGIPGMGLVDDACPSQRLGAVTTYRRNLREPLTGRRPYTLQPAEHEARSPGPVCASRARGRERLGVENVTGFDEVKRASAATFRTGSYAKIGAQGGHSVERNPR